MGIDCPLCNSDSSISVDRVDVEDLDYFYRRRFEISVIDHFPGIREIKFYSCPVCSLKYFDPMVCGSHQFYLQLNQNSWYYLEEKSEYRTAARSIPAGSRVLDIGCGEGKFARVIPGCDYVGLEKNLSIDQRVVGSQVAIIPEYIEEHAIDHAEEYDVVCSFQVLEHISGISDFLEKSLKCLKPGGLLIVSVPSADSFNSQTVNGVLNMPPHHLSWWPDETLEYISRRYGLEMVKIIHEPLEKIHFRRYALNRSLALVSSVLGKRYRLIDRSYTFQLLTLLLLPLALLRSILLWKDAGTIPGHSAVALYRKGK